MTEQDLSLAQPSFSAASLCPEIPTDADKERQIADLSYKRLRAAVAKHITAAIESGKLLVQEKPHQVPGGSPSMLIYGPVQFSHWHAHLPRSAQQYYNCEYCKQLWVTLAGLATLDARGLLEYPVAKAFVEVSDDPAIVQLLNAYPEVQQAIETAGMRKATLLPVSHLSPMLVERDAGGFDHFYGIQDAEALNKWNAIHHPVNDFAYVKGLYEVLTSTEYDGALLSKLFTYIKKEIGEKEHTALGHADDLVGLVDEVRAVQRASGKGLLYLWAGLHLKSNSWMLHIGGSLLGVVLDTAIDLKDKTDMPMALLRVKRLLADATSGENYKQKTAEAPEAAVDQAFMFLTTNNLAGALERKLMSIREVTSIVWAAGDLLGVTAQEELPQQHVENATEAAFRQLKEKKNPLKATHAELDGILGETVVERRISLQEFARTVGEYVELALSPESRLVSPVFTTTAVKEGDHEKLLNFDKEVGPTASMLGTPQPVPFDVFASIAATGIDPVALWQGGAPSIKVTAVFRSNLLDAESANFIMHVPGFAVAFQQKLAHHGSCILGSMIKSEHFGMSRALVELSKQIPMQTQAGAEAAGGVFITPGLVFNAVCKDGTKAKIFLTSVK